jgi:hypothetical protein
MKLRAIVIALAALTAGGCATEIYQDGKTAKDIQRDLDDCRYEARQDSIDPITERIFVDQCMKKRGYRFRDKPVA